MGMDVVGRNPRTEAGEYFRANVWSWGPIHNLIRRRIPGTLRVFRG
jgi:hypothetical protein